MLWFDDRRYATTTRMVFVEYEYNVVWCMFFKIVNQVMFACKKLLLIDSVSHILKVTILELLFVTLYKQYTFKFRKLYKFANESPR